MDGLFRNTLSLNTMIENENPDMINLQECNTRRANASAIAKELDQRHIMSLNCKDDNAPLTETTSAKPGILFKATGTANIWRQDSSLEIKPLPTDTYQMSATEIKYKGKTILNVNCYFPTDRKEGKQDDKYEEYINTLTTFVNNNRHPDSELVITGDFNIHNTEKSNKLSRQPRIDAYNKMLKDLDVTEQRTNCDTYTSKDPNKHSSSELDWALISNGLTLIEIKVITGSNLQHSSDHNPVAISVGFKYSDTETKTKEKVNDSNRNFRKTKRTDWTTIDTKMYNILTKYFFSKLPKETTQMKSQCQFKIYSDLMNLAAELSKKRHKYKRADTKKPSNLISREIELRKINMMIEKLKATAQKTPDEEKLLTRLLSERQHTRKKVKIAQKDWTISRQTSDLEALESLIRDNTTNKIYQELKKLNTKKQAGNPDRIVVYGKQYSNHDVIRGFETLTRS